MSIPLLSLTDSDEVRATVGVDDSDFPDATVSAMGLDNDLEADLLTWLPTYTTVISEGTTGTPTSDQRLKYLNLKNYAKYFCAYLVASASQLMAPQKESDGANELQRFTTDKLTDLLARLSAKRDKYRSDIEYQENAGSYTHSLFSTVSPTYDPVANETA